MHFVNEQLDGGPIIAQSRIEVRAADSEPGLRARIHALEHHCYPQVVGWFAAGRLELRDDGVFLDQDRLPACGIELPPPAGP